MDAITREVDNLLEINKKFEEVQVEQREVIRRLIKRLKAANQLFRQTESHFNDAGDVFVFRHNIVDESGEVAQLQLELNKKTGEITCPHYNPQDFFKGVVRSLENKLKNEQDIINNIKKDIFE